MATHIIPFSRFLFSELSAISTDLLPRSWTFQLLFFLFPILNYSFYFRTKLFYFFSLQTNKKTHILYTSLSKKHILLSFPSTKIHSLFSYLLLRKTYILLPIYSHYLFFFYSHYLVSLLFSGSFVKGLSSFLQISLGKGTIFLKALFPLFSVGSVSVRFWVFTLQR